MTVAAIEPTTPETALVVAGSTGANLIREAALVMSDAHKLAVAVCSTQMVPKHFQGKPDECAAAMLYGASLGFDPMQSLRQIYVVHGQAALYSRAMDALVKGNGHETWTVTTSDESVTVAGRRRGTDRIEESTWTYQRAQKAGYTNNEKYRTDPQAMLYSKALSEVCRKIAPDVLNGVYSVEEMQLERIVVEQVADTGLARILASPPISDASTAPSVPPSAEVEQVVATVGASESPEMTKRTRGELFALFAQKGIEETEQLPGINALVGKVYTSRADVTEEDALAVIAFLRTKPDAAVEAELVEEPSA